jgi:hypothetical protein
MKRSTIALMIAVLIAAVTWILFKNPDGSPDKAGGLRHALLGGVALVADAVGQAVSHVFSR